VGAVDAQTGTVRWVTSLPSLKTGGASGAGTGTSGTVVVGSIAVAASNEGVVFGIDRATGEIRWTGPRAAPPPGYFGVPRPLEDDTRQVTATGGFVISHRDSVLSRHSPPTDVCCGRRPHSVGRSSRSAQTPRTSTPRISPANWPRSRERQVS